MVVFDGVGAASQLAFPSIIFSSIYRHGFGDFITMLLQYDGFSSSFFGQKYDGFSHDDAFFFIGPWS